ncbi:hypothetical protein N665_0218s0004 [Sinapis alba]|nr:hypothetical protein N665_0218s0004 [Sinapis alba]
MTYVPGTDTLAWSDEQTRFCLQLRIEEKLKGNVRKQNVNDAGRQTGGMSCVSYNVFPLILEWPAARKLKEKPVTNMDLMEKVFGTVHISGGEGWTAQQGEDHLDMQGEDHLVQDHDDGDAEDTDATDRRIPPTQETNAPAESRTIGPSSSSRQKANRKRSRAAQVGQAVADVLSDKNKLIGCHPEFSCNQLKAMEVLHSLSAIKLWSPFYKAAINHLKQDPTNRQTFLFYEEDENKVLYLEFATGESRDA